MSGVMREGLRALFTRVVVEELNNEGLLVKRFLWGRLGFVLWRRWSLRRRLGLFGNGRCRQRELCWQQMVLKSRLL